ncbi:glycosyltransferase [Candidatus Electronema sp. JM]|uniref:glycosyltransferase n=1 Tax=Candidatus Electronema sp. JM TaxID=3401571 RepID=UPI003AA902EB
MDIKTDKILVTFALFSYNQENYIRKALHGALTQTYSPLEIIISDDCSEDKTWEIIQEVVKAYQGEHRVVINRNQKNMGITSHVNKMFSMAKGELIIMAAGDDVSESHRAAMIADHWIANGKPTCVLHSALLTISDIKNFIPKRLSGKGYHCGHELNIDWYLNNNKLMMPIIGSTAAYTRNLYYEFGPMLEGGIIEDMVLTFRALLIGQVFYIDDILVRYRISEHNISMGQKRSDQERWIKWIKSMQKCISNNIKDYLIYCKYNNIYPDVKIMNSLNEIYCNYGALLNFLGRNPLKILFALHRYPGKNSCYSKISFLLYFFLANNIFYLLLFKTKLLFNNIFSFALKK